MSHPAPIVVFAGPTLASAEVRRLLPQADVQPPAERGDVLRAALRRPAAICLLDGYFEHRLALNHKEILWALSRGIAVYGASSMGALRAAELDVYGMIGVGEIYRAFATGELENDDEVAVTHGPAPAFQRGSEPLVNLRATLRRALAGSVLTQDTATALTRWAEELFYPERNYRNMVAHVAGLALPASEREMLQLWLSQPSNWIDQKQADAQLCLRQLAGWQSMPAAVTDWEFVWSSAWAKLWGEVVGPS